MDRRLQKLVLLEQLTQVQNTLRELRANSRREHARFGAATQATLESIAAAEAAHSEITEQYSAL